MQNTTLHTVAKGFDQMAPPALTIIVALDMSKAFDTINIHTLIRKLPQTNIPDTIIKFIANYMKGRKAYTTYRNHTSKQRQFKTGVPQSGVLSPTLDNICMGQPASHAEQSIEDCHRLHTRHKHMHDETLTLPIHENLQLYATQFKQKTQHPSHALHKYTTYFNNSRQNTIFQSAHHTTNISIDPHTVTTTDIKTNIIYIHTSIVSGNLATRGHNKILRTPPPHIISFEEIIPRLTRPTLAQLKTNKSPFLKSYLHTFDAKPHTSPQCPPL